MTEAEIAAALDRAEAAVDSGEGLGGTGFWKVVGDVKRNPHLVKDYGDRIAAIDRRAFENWAVATVPIGTGTALAALATGIGAVGVGSAYHLDEPWSWLTFGAGTTGLLVTTHGLAHLVVGKATGMRFTHWFIGSMKRPQPGVKVDYATYLTTPARKRAWMHASGALMTKIVPFALIPVAIAADLPDWVPWLTGIAGVGMVLADVLWSVKASDWKKFHREMSYAD